MGASKLLGRINFVTGLRQRNQDRLGEQALSKFHPASLLLAPALGLCLSWGDADIYRVTQFITIVLIALLSFRYVQRHPCRISGVALVLLASLWFPYLFVLLRDSAMGANNHEMITLWKLLSFTILLVAFDLSRRNPCRQKGP